MSIVARILNFILLILAHILLKLDADEIKKLPRNGPIIMIGPHVNFLDVPVMSALASPRRVTGWVKHEWWTHWFLGALFHIWGGIPIYRGEVDRAALRKAREKLQEGYILGIAPEGTRNGSGKLIRGHPGVVVLAQYTGAPILPVAFFGHENFHENYRRLRRTPFHVVVGETFHIDTHGERVTNEMRQEIIDEMMYQVAALMPEQYRGYYCDLSKATTKYIRFDEKK